MTNVLTTCIICFNRVMKIWGPSEEEEISREEQRKMMDAGWTAEEIGYSLSDVKVYRFTLSIPPHRNLAFIESTS